jgi:hypothetical protein
MLPDYAEGDTLIHPLMNGMKKLMLNLFRLPRTSHV